MVTILKANLCFSVVLTCILLTATVSAVGEYIVIDSGNECIEKTCISFEGLLQNVSAYFEANSQIKFNPGEYTVVKVTQVVVHSIRNISLSSVDDSQLTESSTIINCNSKLSFIFIKVTDLRLSGLTFVKCGLQVAPQLFRDSILLHDTFSSVALYAAFFFADVDGLSVAKVSIIHSHGYGVLGVNVRGNSTIEDSIMRGNASQASLPLHVISRWDTQYDVHCFFGNAWFLSDSNDTFLGELRFSFRNIIISWTNTFYNCHDVQYGVYVQTGLGFEFQQRSYLVDIDINNVTVISANINAVVRGTANNVAFAMRSTVFFGGIASYTFNMNPRGKNKWTHGNHASQHVYEVAHCEFTSALHQGLKSHFDVFFISKTVFEAVQTVNIVVYKCSFSGEEIVGGLRISSPSMVTGSRLEGTIHVSHCKFINISDMKVLSFEDSNYHKSKFVSVHLDFCKFNNTDLTAYGSSAVSLSISNTIFDGVRTSVVLNLINVSITDTEFKNIRLAESALILRGSNVHFEGSTVFENNHGVNGGAIGLLFFADRSTGLRLHSTLHFHTNSRVYLVNNTALNLGGGIYVEEDITSASRYEPCFYQLEGWNGVKTFNANVVMENNTAVVAGNSVYGGMDKLCNLFVDGDRHQWSGSIVFNNLFRIKNTISSSEFASVVQQICLCWPIDRMIPHCEVIRSGYRHNVFPGQVFGIPIVALGKSTNIRVENGAVPTVVFSSVSSGATLDHLQSVQRLPNHCSMLKFKLFTQKVRKWISLSIFISTFHVLNENNRIMFNITILPCPFGFHLQGGQCECMAVMIENHCKCTKNTTYIYTCPERFWIKYETNEIYKYGSCPLHFCISTWEGSNDANGQCSSNRTGVLCGECKPEHSLALGTSHCLPNCSNWYVFLLFPFALAGIILVFLLLFCNVTVTVGNINGFVYFANIVGFNSDIFFPKSRLDVVSVFISWLNLDLGIETCFYKGMNMYEKTWLQFVFPFYIWFLVIIIIVSSHYSVLVSKLTRSNSVPVLATLLRLSYAKLLHTIIVTFSFTSLHSSNATKITVWLYDGNIPFLHGHHIPLFLFALLALVLLVLPYTALLLLSPYLQAWASYSRLRWVTRIKPFLDAYHGPYRDKFRNWTGVILFVQTIQFLAFALNSLGESHINLLVIIITSTAVMAVSFNCGVIYKNKLNNAVESMCIVLLIMLAGSSLYLEVFDDDSRASKQAGVSFGIIMVLFIVFVMVLIYHTIGVLRAVFEHIKARMTKQKSNENIAEFSELDTVKSTHQQSCLCTTSELREPLLDDQ